MGGNWSQSESWYNLVTKDEVRDAMKGFKEWEKVQAETKAAGVVKPSLPTTGPLVDRIGGPDAVKRVVEGFCRRLYADEQLQTFLQGRDIIYMRNKLSTFASWLFGPAYKPYTGKHLRTAHLRLIRQRGFGPEHFERGMTYFQEAICELGVPEALVNEAMAKLRPFKGAVFTESPKDAEEEARWAAEERAKQLQLQLQQREEEQQRRQTMEAVQVQQQQQQQDQDPTQQHEHKGEGEAPRKGQPQQLEQLHAGAALTEEHRGRPEHLPLQQPQQQQPRLPLSYDGLSAPARPNGSARRASASATVSTAAAAAAAAAASAWTSQCPFSGGGDGGSGGRMPRSSSAVAASAVHSRRLSVGGVAYATAGAAAGGAAMLHSHTSTGFASHPATPLHRVPPSPSASAASAPRHAPSSAQPAAALALPPPPALAALPPGLAALPPPPPLRHVPLGRVSQPSSGLVTPRSPGLGFGVGPGYVSTTSREQSARSSFTGGFGTAMSSMDSPVVTTPGRRAGQ